MADELTKERRGAIFERMALMRRFEEMVTELAKDNSFGHYHLYIGEEATGAATIEALRPGDLTSTTHRNHGHMVGRGVDPGGALAEIMGRSGGLNGGFGGTLHLTDRSAGFLSTSAVVGGSIGIATGAGYRLKRAGDGSVSVGFFGDAALEEGIAFESLNMAALWSLPVLYVCENNARGAPGAKAGEFSSSTMAIQDLADIPGALGIATEVVDGADVDAVFAAVSRAVARLRAGDGPVFIEAVTERWPGSRPLWPELSTGITDLDAAWDDGRITGEHAGWIRDHDPVLRYARTLVSEGEFSADELREMDRRVQEGMDAARAFAEASPLPALETALHGVFG